MPDTPEFSNYFLNRPLLSINGRNWFAGFGWIHEDGDPLTVALTIANRLRDISLKPADTWFPK